MSAVRNAAAVIAALALVAIALFTYQSAQADREAACWLRTTAHADIDLALFALADITSASFRFNRIEAAHDAYSEMHNDCEIHE